MKNAQKILIISILTILIAGGFVLPTDEAVASVSCANGTTLTAQELYNAVWSGKLIATFSEQPGQVVASVNNLTGCTAPVIGASYKMYNAYGTPGWLDTQQYIGSSVMVNINANGITTITVPVASCRTQVDLWYQAAPQQLYDSVDYGSYLDANYAFAAYATQTALCTATPVCTPSWQTGAWGECINGYQTRTVTDANACGVETSKPSTTQSCAVAPVITPLAQTQTQTQTQVNTQTVYVNTTGGGNNNTCSNHAYQRCSGSNLYWYDSCGNQQEYQYCPNGCYNNACQNYTNTYGSLTINKTVRNLASGSTNFASSVYANPLDTLMFMITLQANGNQNMQNVFVRDYFPANLIYQNQLIVSGGSNYYNNNSGNIVSGINIGTISSGQTATITYQAQVASAQNFAYGATTLNNSASATSSVGSTPTASASVIVNRAAVYGASAISTGLTNNFLVDSFFLPLMITLLGILMLKSGMFAGAEKWFYARKKNGREFRASRELSKKISEIRKFGS